MFFHLPFIVGKEVRNVFSDKKIFAFLLINE